jgi:hypothetical protein
MGILMKRLIIKRELLSLSLNAVNSKLLFSIPEILISKSWLLIILLKIGLLNEIENL